MVFTYFITGGNRGVGLGLVKEILKEKDDVKIVVSVRDPEKATELQEVAKESGKVHIVKLEVGSQESIEQLHAQIEKVAPEGIDFFIANAGIAAPHAYAITFSPEVYLEIYKVNVIGNVFIFKEIYPLLVKKTTRKIGFISSSVGSLTDFAPFHVGPYGASKAALNYMTKSLQFDYTDEGFCFVDVHPGLVDTDMQRSANISPEFYEKNPKISVEESASGIMKVFKSVTDKDKGKFYDWNGEEHAF